MYHVSLRFLVDCEEIILSNLLNANFTGEDEYPVLNKQKEDLVIPFQMIRFSDRKIASLNDAICFYEWDKSFESKLKDERIAKLVPSLLKAGSVVQPDYSIYADEPLVLQKFAVYEKNRVALELQNYGLNIIPNLRWGDKRSYDFVFQGIPKHQVCSVGTYGQIADKEKRILFEAGLEIALERVRPKKVLVYGTMPDDIFGSYKRNIKFIRYPSWQEIFAKEAC